MLHQDSGEEVERAVRILKAIVDGDAAYVPQPIRTNIFLRDNLP